ncbi:MAG: M48 family metallopeptidase [Novosphingobium sp.]|nr:M48 family metallopeptidase [Novosphingobium sp.]
MRTQWGSCSLDGVIYLNPALIAANLLHSRVLRQIGGHAVPRSTRNRRRLSTWPARRRP